jgi:excisionase family DNA binding protein
MCRLGQKQSENAEHSPGTGIHQEDRLLTIDQAAAKLMTSKDWFYRNSGRLPFTLRIGRNLRFSEQGIERWIMSRTGRV